MEWSEYLKEVLEVEDPGLWVTEVAELIMKEPVPWEQSEAQACKADL